MDADSILRDHRRREIFEPIVGGDASVHDTSTEPDEVSYSPPN
jgi:hypothetical protein